MAQPIDTVAFKAAWAAAAKRKAAMDLGPYPHAPARMEFTKLVPAAPRLLTNEDRFQQAMEDAPLSYGEY